MSPNTNKKVPRKRKLNYFRLIIFLIIISLIIGGVGLAIRAVVSWINTNMTNSSVPAANISPQITAERYQDYTNILIIGTNSLADTSSQADAIGLLSINKHDNTIRLLSIPPILQLNDHISPTKATSQTEQEKAIPSPKDIINLRDSLTGEGPVNLTNKVANLLQVPITKYILIDVNTIAKLVNEEHGLSLYVEESMDYEDSIGSTAIHLTKGYQTLSGEQVEQYLRYRSDELGDIGRIQRQERITKALWYELTRKSNLVFIPTYISIIKNNSQSNINFYGWEIVPLVYHILGHRQIEVHTLPGYQEHDGSWSVSQKQLTATIDALFPEIPQNK